jgi:hypothetical protein
MMAKCFEGSRIRCGKIRAAVGPDLPHLSRAIFLGIVRPSVKPAVSGEFLRRVATTDCDDPTSGD